MNRLIKIFKNIFMFILLPVFILYSLYKIIKSKNISIISAKGGNIRIDNTPEVNKEDLVSALSKGKDIMDKLSK